MMEAPTLPIRKTSTCPTLPSTPLTTFCRLDELGLEALVIDHLTVARAAASLGVLWHTANTAILQEGRRLLIDDPHRFDGVTTIGVDEHIWWQTRRGDTYVTVIIDLTRIREKRGPARLLDMVEGDEPSGVFD